MDQILSAAFEVADDVSIDNLSMPVLARRLGVGVTSIYWYFRRKDDLLDAMTAQAITDAGIVAPPIDPADWRASLRLHSVSVRASFSANPVLCDLVLFRRSDDGRVARAALHATEQAVAALITAGMTSADALDLYSAVSTHTRTSIVLQRIQERSHYGGLHYGDQLQQGNLVDPDTMPMIAASHRGRRIGIADDHTFAHTLDCLLDRAEVTLSRAPS